MINPDRVVVISVMVGIVAAGFTWFGWELFENLFAMAGRAVRQKKEAAAERERQRREAAEKEVKEQLGQQ